MIESKNKTTEKVTIGAVFDFAKMRKEEIEKFIEKLFEYKDVNKSNDINNYNIESDGSAKIVISVYKPTSLQQILDSSIEEIEDFLSIFAPSLPVKINSVEIKTD